MGSMTTIGRCVGGVILTTFVVGLLSNFKLQTDLFGAGGFLVNAAAHPYKVGVVVALGTFTSLLSLWIASLLYANFGRSHPQLSLVYLGLVIAGLAMSTQEHSTLLTMRALSEQYVAAGGEPSAMYQALRSVVAGLRNGIHFPDKLLGGAGLVVLFGLFHQARLIPRPLAMLGLLTAPLQMIAVGMPLFGYPVIYPMLAPIALVYLATALWLLVKGFPNGDEQGDGLREAVVH